MAILLTLAYVMQRVRYTIATAAAATSTPGSRLEVSWSWSLQVLGSSWSLGVLESWNLGVLES
jgi:hypothetical protein